MDALRRLWDACCQSINNKPNAQNRTPNNNINNNNNNNNISNNNNNKRQQPNTSLQQHPQQQQSSQPHQHDVSHGNNIALDASNSTSNTTTNSNNDNNENNKIEVDALENSEDFESKYKSLIADLGLDDKAKEALLGFSREKKFKLYRQISATNERVSYYVELLEDYSKKTNQTDIDIQTDTLERLRALLRSGRVSFVKDFLTQGGLNALLVAIETFSKKYPYHRINEVSIGCLKNSMNCQEGRKMVLKSDRAIDVVATMAISHLNRNEKARVVAIGILSGLCMVPGGHLKVLAAFNHVQSVASERWRFEILLRDLECTSSAHLTIGILVLINSLINYGAGSKLLEFRLHLRYEFLMQGLTDIIDKVKKTDNSLYDKHIDFFEMVRKRDEKEFYDKTSINKKRVDSKSVASMTDHLKQRNLLSPTYPHLLSILYHLILIPHNSPWSLQQWKLIDKLVQETAVPQLEGSTNEGVNMKNMLSKLSQDDASKEMKKKLEEREKELGEMKSLLEKREKEVVVRAEEKNILLETLSGLKRKLEVEAEEHRRQLDGLNEQLKELKKSGGVLHGGSNGANDESHKNDDINSRESFTKSIRSHNTDANEIDDVTSTSSVPTQSDHHQPKSSIKTSNNLTHSEKTAEDFKNDDEIPTAPPLPLLPGASIPPPPPPLPLLSIMPPPRNIPQPKQPTKCFNWTKLPEHKISHSIWKDLSDQEIYPTIDLEELEKKFSAYQRSQQAPQGSKTAAKELSLMDGRRSQNCNIMLSKLKMNNEQLIEALKAGDPADSLSRDVCDQLLKFLPTSEEVSLLKEHESESSQMAKPDLFLFKISQVEHYEQMLNGITFKKKFNERVTDLSSGMKAVLEASQVCVKSTSFRRVLEIVLAVGNFMNGGSRGNASGFKLNSLAKLQDTKASDHKSSLMHYLAQLCADKFPETDCLEEDLSSTREASKVNLQEVDVEMRSLKVGLKELDSEAKYEEGRNAGFSVQMKQFLQVGCCRYDNLQELSARMKKQYNEMLESFCEESSVQPDECFKHAVALLDSMADAKKENLAFKKQQEEEEAKVLREAEMRSDREKKRFASTTNICQDEDMGEFDAMIRTLMTGDAYDGTMGRGKRGNVKKLSLHSESLVEEEPAVHYRRTRQSKSLANILESRERIMHV